jgi:endonuclease/exonuclease/phosphatase family metal-dependent hydrolase
MDRRVRPGRIVDVLSKLDADIIALQEVLRIESDEPESDQANFIAKELGYHYAFGETCSLLGGRYGNVVLSRSPIHFSRHYEVSFRARVRKPRGCLRVDVDLPADEKPETRLHVFNVHLGTGYFERHYQANRLTKDSILDHIDVKGPRIVLGDFNEWMRGSASRLLGSLFETPDIRKHLNRSRTYPGLLPVVHLDNIYFDPSLTLENLTLCRDREALVASDHLPLVADFKWNARAREENRKE